MVFAAIGMAVEVFGVVNVMRTVASVYSLMRGGIRYIHRSISCCRSGPSVMESVLLSMSLVGSRRGVGDAPLPHCAATWNTNAFTSRKVASLETRSK